MVPRPSQPRREAGRNEGTVARAELPGNCDAGSYELVEARRRRGPLGERLITEGLRSPRARLRRQDVVYVLAEARLGHWWARTFFKINGCFSRLGDDHMEAFSISHPSLWCYSLVGPAFLGKATAAGARLTGALTNTPSASVNLL